MPERMRRGRKLLIASIGVAAVSYVACGGDDTSGSSDGGTGGSVSTGGGPGDGAVGNLMPFPDAGAGATGTGGTAADSGSSDSSPNDGQASDTGPIFGFDVVANLLPPPPPDQ